MSEEIETEIKSILERLDERFFKEREVIAKKYLDEEITYKEMAIEYLLIDATRFALEKTFDRIRKSDNPAGELLKITARAFGVQVVDN